MDASIYPSIFKDYDIRGIYPSQLSETVIALIGKAICAFLKVGTIAVGHDCRQSSPALFEALTTSIMEMGVNVINLGQISTEIHYFASGKRNYPANIIISASHNPPQYNGLKIVTAGVVPISGEYGLPQIKNLAINSTFNKASKPGTMKEESVVSEWIDHALSFVDTKNLKPLKVVVDAGNGMAGISWIRVIEKLPVKIIPMFFEPDGTFPNHLPDPLNEQNLSHLKIKIIEEKADLGFAMDGDADRLFVLDETATMLSGTITTAMLADLILSKRGKAPVLYNAVCGKIVPETIEKHSGIPVRVRVGHSFIKRAMKDYHAVFGGEHSGHFYFDKNFNADSSLIAGLLFLEYLSQKNVPLSKVVGEFSKYKPSGEINFKVDDTERVIDAIANRFSDATGQDHLDGLSVWYPNFWFNLRSSKTEPLLRLNLEADNDTVMKGKLQEVTGVLISLGGIKHA